MSNPRRRFSASWRSTTPRATTTNTINATAAMKMNLTAPALLGGGAPDDDARYHDEHDQRNGGNDDELAVARAADPVEELVQLPEEEPEESSDERLASGRAICRLRDDRRDGVMDLAGRR